jgi:hypothetical protein
MAISPTISRKTLLFTLLTCALSLPLALFIGRPISKKSVNPQKQGSLSILRFSDTQDGQCVVLGMNDKTEVVGAVLSGKDKHVHGYVWRKEMGPYPHLLTTPKGFTDSVATTINARGRIVGDTY